MLQPLVQQIHIAKLYLGDWDRNEAPVTPQALPVTPAALLRLSGQVAFLDGPDMKTEEQQWPTAPALRRGTQDLTVKEARRQEQGDGRPRVGECPLLTHPPARWKKKGARGSGRAPGGHVSDPPHLQGLRTRLPGTALPTATRGRPGPIAASEEAGSQKLGR